jgi:hypothetical protein
MPQNHPSLENSYYKTILVINSCRTKDQLDGAFEMVENFKEMYKQVGFPKLLSYNLDRELTKKIGSLSQ